VARNTSVAKVNQLRLATVRVSVLPESLRSEYDRAWALLLAKETREFAQPENSSDADQEGSR
jgi:hypothetical protein